MSLYALVLVVHVVVAVLGIGSMAGVAIVISAASKSERSSPELPSWLTPLLRYATWSLVVLFVTGGVLDRLVGGAFHTAWWFRGSALLLLVTGFLLGQARRAVKRALKGESDPGETLRRVQRISYGICALVGVIIALMEAKPF